MAPGDGSILLLLVQVGVTLGFHFVFNNGVLGNSFLISNMLMNLVVVFFLGRGSELGWGQHAAPVFLKFSYSRDCPSHPDSYVVWKATLPFK